MGSTFQFTGQVSLHDVVLLGDFNHIYRVSNHLLKVSLRVPDRACVRFTSHNADRGLSVVDIGQEGCSDFHLPHHDPFLELSSANLVIGPNDVSSDPSHWGFCMLTRISGLPRSSRE